ncbi:MAG TPA: vitamin K epoxide reductase family protein [Terriglobales bacterium]
MRFLLALIALIGLTAASLALREHYRTDVSPCSINERWDCGIVNHSPFAVVAGGIPVAVIGMIGYLFMAALALTRSYRLLLAAAIVGLAYSLYLAHIEASILGVWCVYCVASLVCVALLTLLAFGTIIVSRLRDGSARN